jgi:hypothetical protein
LTDFPDLSVHPVPDSGIVSPSCRPTITVFSGRTQVLTASGRSSYGLFRPGEPPLVSSRWRLSASDERCWLDVLAVKLCFLPPTGTLEDPTVKWREFLLRRAIEPEARSSMNWRGGW